MNAPFNILDFWVGMATRMALYQIRIFAPVMMAFLPDPKEDEALRRAYGLLSQRVVQIEERLEGL